LIDRFDLMIAVPAVAAADLLLPAPAEGSSEVAERVTAAREIQVERYRALGLPLVSCNAVAPAGIVEEALQPDAAARGLLREAAERMRLSARGYHRVLKLARTLADLDGGGAVLRIHLAEALSYRATSDRTAIAA
jgi:magnesium chelatase family protein